MSWLRFAFHINLVVFGMMTPLDFLLSYLMNDVTIIVIQGFFDSTFLIGISKDCNPLEFFLHWSLLYKIESYRFFFLKNSLYYIP